MPNAKHCMIELSAIPSVESKQILQPNLLHVTMMNESTRKASWKSKLTADHWKIKIKVVENRALLLTTENGEEVEKSVNCIRNDSLVLGEGGLLLTIITPLQDRNRGDPKVRIV